MPFAIRKSETRYQGYLTILAVVLDSEDHETLVREVEDHGRREALEEAGVRLSALEPLGQPFSSPGVSTERVALFLAPYAQADRVSDGGGLVGEHEHITVVETPLAEFWTRVEQGGIDDLKTLALAYGLRARHPELF
jgi:8-oxo-dGTP pyrophosphatase MutT (NUDIX family)